MIWWKHDVHGTKCSFHTNVYLRHEAYSVKFLLHHRSCVGRSRLPWFCKVLPTVLFLEDNMLTRKTTHYFTLHFIISWCLLKVFLNNVCARACMCVRVCVCVCELLGWFEETLFSQASGCRYKTCDWYFLVCPQLKGQVIAGQYTWLIWW